MAGKSGFLRAIDKARKDGFMVGQRFTRQLCMDCMAIVLNREFGFGAERISRFYDAMSKQYADYADIWNKDTADVEYAKDTMDRALRQIWGDRFQPWEERYN